MKCSYSVTYTHTLLTGAHGSQLQSLLGMGGPQRQQLMEQLMSSSGLGPPGGMLSPYEAVRSPRYKGQSGVQLEDTTGVQCIVFLSEQPW